MTVYKMDKGTLVEFASRLKTTGGLVKLQGRQILDAESQLDLSIHKYLASSQDDDR